MPLQQAGLSIYHVGERVSKTSSHCSERPVILLTVPQDANSPEFGGWETSEIRILLFHRILCQLDQIGRRKSRVELFFAIEEIDQKTSMEEWKDKKIKEKQIHERGKRTNYACFLFLELVIQAILVYNYLKRSFSLVMS